MTIRARTVAAITAGALAATAASAAAAPSPTLWHTRGFQVNCGIEIHPPSARATEVLCSAAGIPAPRTGFGDGGFVQLAATGASQTLRLSQNSFIGSHSSLLKPGARWSKLGVSCNVGRSSVLCFNGDNHGFRIGDGHYRSF